MSVEEIKEKIPPLVSDLMVKETDSTWISQGFESIFIAFLIITIVFSVLYFFMKKMPLKSLMEHSINSDIEIVSIKKITRSSNMMVVRWHSNEYLIVEGGQGITVIDKRNIENKIDD